jgi:RimJ/RimL family protein N-acetyltransferase
MSTLQTARLKLRPFRESDLDGYAAMCANADVMRYLGESKPWSRAEAWRSMALMVGHWQLRGYGMWAVEERQSGEFIGRIGCWNPEGWPGLEIGWTLRREFWGRGFATEGARAAIQYAFTELHQTRVISLIRPDNLNSIRVAKRVGEQLDGEADVMGHRTLVYALRNS